MSLLSWHGAAGTHKSPKPKFLYFNKRWAYSDRQKTHTMFISAQHLIVKVLSQKEVLQKHKQATQAM